MEVLHPKVSDRPSDKPQPFCAKPANAKNEEVLGVDAEDFVAVAAVDFVEDAAAADLEDGVVPRMAWDAVDRPNMVLPVNMDMDLRGRRQRLMEFDCETVMNVNDRTKARRSLGQTVSVIGNNNWIWLQQNLGKV